MLQGRIGSVQLLTSSSRQVQFLHRLCILTYPAISPSNRWFSSRNVKMKYITYNKKKNEYPETNHSAVYQRQTRLKHDTSVNLRYVISQFTCVCIFTWKINLVLKEKKRKKRNRLSILSEKVKRNKPVGIGRACT